nr:hypothetical protein [Anaplasma marginale]
MLFRDRWRHVIIILALLLLCLPNAVMVQGSAAAAASKAPAETAAPTPASPAPSSASTSDSSTVAGSASTASSPAVSTPAVQGPEGPPGSEPGPGPGGEPGMGGEGEQSGPLGGACWLTKQTVKPVGRVRSSGTNNAVPAGAGINVCAAWPACGTCVRMYEGDCRHVYPSFVMVYSAHDDTKGAEQICACKAKSCYLPWDSTEWSKNCYQHLACYDKAVATEAGPFCNVLPRHHRPTTVRFVPLEFSKQSYWIPGFVAIVESWEHKNGVMTKKVSKHVIHPGGKQPETASSNASNSSQGVATTTASSPGTGTQAAAIAMSDVSQESQPAATGGQPTTANASTTEEEKQKRTWHTVGEKINGEPKDYSFSDNGKTHHLKARRVHDTVCVEYYGADQNRESAISGGCVPIPTMERPLVYQAFKVYDSNKPYTGRYEIPNRTNLFGGSLREWAYACPMAVSIAKNHDMLQKEGNTGGYRVDFYWSGYKWKGQHPDCMAIAVDKRQGTCDCFAGEEKFIDCNRKCNANTSGSVPTCVFGLYDGKERMVRKEQKLTRNEISQNTSTAERDIKRMVTQSVGRHCIFAYKQCVRFNGTTTCHDEKERSEDWSGTHYDKPRDMFVGYATEQFASGQEKQEEQQRRGESSAKFLGVTADPALREMRRYCANVEDIEGKSEVCWYKPAENAPANVLCVSGVGSDVSEYEIRSKSDEGVARTWLRKQPKVLRRYVLVDVGNDTRRVACDDKYSIVLGSLSQDILDKTTVQDGQYIFPKEFLERSFVKGGSDPCSSPDAKIVYYYESGGFTSDPGVLSRCSHPVTQYYGPGKEVKGCAYEYVSMDDYRPLTFSGITSEHNVPATGTTPVPAAGQAQANVAVQSSTAQTNNAVQTTSSNEVPKKLTTDLELRPLNPYDRGLCIDKFPRHWYEPRYIFSSGTQYEVGNTDNPTVTKDYVMLKFKAEDKNQPRGCNFYRIEAWGGGEAAATTAMGERRSGRPGQYSMVVLRNPNCTDEGCQAFSENKGSRNVKDLELSIEVEVGEGGKSGKNKKNPTTGENHDLGVGGDTIVKFCVCASGNCTSASSGQNANSNSNGKRCYTIMTAVGGGSKRAGTLDESAIKNLVVSYRTITGDVLADDDGATKLLLEGRAMFTKFPLEMNFPLYDQEGNTRKWLDLIAEHFRGRSLPRELCTWKDMYYIYRGFGDFFIPGMGGCWHNEKGKEPGLGESGAAMITCELWDDTRAPTFSGNETKKPDTNGHNPPTTPPAAAKPAATKTEATKPVVKPAAAPVPVPKIPGKCGDLPAGSCKETGDGGIAVTYRYCPWWARFQISSWDDHYACTGGIRTYTEKFSDVKKFEAYSHSWVRVRRMSGCDDKSCVHYRDNYTNKRG